MGYSFSFCDRGQPGGWSLFLRGQEKVTKRRPPQVSRPFSKGNPALPDSMRRLRNSTWEGTHNMPSHGTQTVLVDFPSSSRAARCATWGPKTKRALHRSLQPLAAWRKHIDGSRRRRCSTGQKRAQAIGNLNVRELAIFGEKIGKLLATGVALL
jgi:hypothetical protein